MPTIEVPISEFRDCLTDYLSRVAYGTDTIIVTRNGKPMVEVRKPEPKKEPS